MKNAVLALLFFGALVIAFSSTGQAGVFFGPSVVGGTGNASVVYADGNYPPSGYTFPWAPNPFTQPACANDPCATPSDFMDSNSTAMVTSLYNSYGFNLGNLYEGLPPDNTFPTYYTSTNAPVFNVYCDAGCGSGSPLSVRITNGATASSGSDHHLDVINLSTGVETLIGQFNETGPGTGGTSNPVYNGGTIYAGYAGVCTLTAFASFGNACQNGGTGSKLPSQPLVVDPREVNAGAVNHTIFIATGCSSTSYVFPAGASDGLCGANGPKYGERLWLDLTQAQINALGNNACITTILINMHKYGWMIADNNGGGSAINIQAVGPTSFTLWGLTNPWTTFWTNCTGSPSGNALTIPTTGITQSNIHVLGVCVNEGNC